MTMTPLPSARYAALIPHIRPVHVILSHLSFFRARLERSTPTSHCPYKGDASYFQLRTEDGLVENAVWSYEAPFEEVKQIKEYLAFYASRVDRIDQTS